MLTDLLFYQPFPVAGEFYMTEDGTVQFLRQHTNWRSTWTQIIPGHFGGGNTTDLLFYDPRANTGEFWATDGIGGISLLKQHTNWRGSWTRIIPGNFGGDGRTDLLFYEAASGTGEFYTVEGSGDIRLLRQQTGWRSSWTNIIPGSFGGDGLTDLLFYDGTNGVGQFYAVQAGGRIAELALHTNWRQNWTQIIPGNFGGGTNFTDLLFYQPTSATGEFYSTDGRGSIVQLSQFTDWRSTWTQIIPGQFGGNGQTDLLFYGGGTGEFYTSTGRGGINLLRTHDDWLTTWAKIVPGIFTPQREVRLCLKFVLDESKFPIEAWLAAMREVYLTAGLRVMVNTREQLVNVAHLEDVEIGECATGFGDNLTAEVAELFRHRQFVADGDIVIYLVRTTTPPVNGCAHHPGGKPGAIVVQKASPWTMAHETGHVLGLSHTDDNHRLMFGGGTDNVVDPPPDLNLGEIQQMQRSRLIRGV